eukprot:jgi/Psemu1/57684/gm1.57684_g
MNTPDLASLFPSFDPALATFLHDSFDIPKESNSTLCAALINARYRTWPAFLHIEYIDDLEYHDGSARVPLTRHVQLKLQRFIDFGQHLTERGLDWEERDQYTKKAFKDYCQGIVQARRDSAVTNRATISTDEHGWPPKPIAQLQYESWIRKPRDETTFPVLQNDATFEHWLVQFTAQLDAYGINPTAFLDPYWPYHVLTGYPKALHEEQCTFFWTLLRHVFQGDFSSSCVLYHQRTRDGRQAYFDFVKLHKPVSHPRPPAAPVSSPGPVPVRPPAVGNIVTPRPTPPVSTHAPVHSTSSTPAVHNSPPTTACKTAPHPTVDNPETPTGLPRSSNPGSTDDSTSTGTYSYTWKYSPSTDSVRFKRIAYSSTPNIVPADTPTGDVPPKRNGASHSTCARTSYPSPANSRWTFYPQSETVVFHRARSTTQPSCTSSLQLPPSGASSNDSVVSSSVTKPLYGASFGPIQNFGPIQKFRPIWTFLYGAQKPLHGASFCPVGKPSTYSMTYDLPAVRITQRHRDAIKINLYQLHATLCVPIGSTATSLTDPIYD